MLVYLDSSALVKLYKPERYSIEIRRLVEGASDCATSALAEVEVCGALARAQRAAALKSADAGRLRDIFLEDFALMTVVQVHPEVLRHAAGLAETHFLRAYDAVHLASALRLRSEAACDVQFVGFDDALNAAAGQENLVLQTLR